MTEDASTHWNRIYSRSNTESLGWYEETPEPSLRLIEKCNLGPSSRVLNVGAGVSTLIEILLQKQLGHIIVNDISCEAINILQNKLVKNSNRIQWIADDLTNPNELKTIEPVDLWHDRAVLHFFVKNEDQRAYFNLLKATVKPGGYAIIAVFNLNGAEKCSGLPLYRYSVEMLEERMSPDFTLIESFNYTFTNPANDERPYVYALFKKKM